MTDVTIPVTPTILKIGTFNIGTRLIGQALAGDVWNTYPLDLPQEGPTLSLGISVPGSGDTFVNNALGLVADTTSLTVGVTDRISVDFDKVLQLADDTADVRIGVTLNGTTGDLELDGVEAILNRKFLPYEDCTDIDLDPLVCSELDLEALVPVSVDFAPLDCVEA